MFELIYNFIKDYLIGNTTFEGANDLAILLTFATIICFFFILIKLVCWAFGVFGNSWKRKGRF